MEKGFPRHHARGLRCGHKRTRVPVVMQLDAVRVLFGVKPRFYLLFRRWMMEQFPGEKIVSLVRDTGSSFTEEAPKMVVEMHLVLCIYFTWSVTVPGG